jgi:hypothetical protein
MLTPESQILASMRRRLSFKRRDRRHSAPAIDPHVHLETCLVCRTDFVNPVDWEPLDGGRWWMLLRCGECDTWRDVTVTDAVAERYDAELDRRLDVIDDALHTLDRQRMVGEVETMVVALRRGLVDAADFTR